MPRFRHGIIEWYGKTNHLARSHGWLHASREPSGAEDMKE